MLGTVPRTTPSIATSAPAALPSPPARKSSLPGRGARSSVTLTDSALRTSRSRSTVLKPRSSMMILAAPLGSLQIERRVAGDPEISRRGRRSRVPVDRRLLRRAVDVDLVRAPLGLGARFQGPGGKGLRHGRPFGGSGDPEQPCETDQQGDPREQGRTHHRAVRVTVDRRMRQLDAVWPRDKPARWATHMSPLISGICAFFVVGLRARPLE